MAALFNATPAQPCKSTTWRRNRYPPDLPGLPRLPHQPDQPYPPSRRCEPILPAFSHVLVSPYASG